jgi:hypothetical protein
MSTRDNSSFPTSTHAMGLDSWPYTIAWVIDDLSIDGQGLFGMHSLKGRSDPDIFRELVIYLSY